MQMFVMTSICKTITFICGDFGYHWTNLFHNIQDKVGVLAAQERLTHGGKLEVGQQANSWTLQRCYLEFAKKEFMKGQEDDSVFARKHLVRMDVWHLDRPHPDVS